MQSARASERALLGACIIDGDAAKNVVDRINEEDFDDRECRVVFSAVKELVKKGTALDIITITDKLESSGTLVDAGGYANVSAMSSDTPNSLNYESYMDIVIGNSTYRALRNVATKVAELSSGTKTPEDRKSVV
jgi:replicative DNA helicase